MALMGVMRVLGLMALMTLKRTLRRSTCWSPSPIA